MPVHSVGVQGDARSYAPVLAIDCFPSEEVRQSATELINRIPGINRVIARVDSTAPLPEMRVFRKGLTPERLARLRKADSAVRRISHASGFDDRIWQFPVVLIPLGTEQAPDSVVLRPVSSVDGMTAQSVIVPEPLLREISAELMRIEGVGGVFHDLTHKPPGTIEWE